MSEQDTTPAPVDTQDQQQWWEVWIDMVHPHRTKMRVDRVPWPPTKKDIDRAVESVMKSAPKHLDLGNTLDGRPVIAFEEFVEVRVVAPDGSQRIVERGPKAMGWQRLNDYVERQSKGEGFVELRMWVWHAAD